MEWMVLWRLVIDRPNPWVCQVSPFDRFRMRRPPASGRVFEKGMPVGVYGLADTVQDARELALIVLRGTR